MDIICLDTEFTGTLSSNEILELSIYDGVGNEIIHQLYKPEKCRSWPHSEKIHGITPEMVEKAPCFRENIANLQQIFDESKLIIGFAVENDVKLLADTGIKRLEEERCLDVRHLYWACRYKEQGKDLFVVPNLVICAGECGFNWDTVKAHSASADALATLTTYNILIKEFIEKYQIKYCGEFMDDDHIKKAIRKLRRMVDEAIYQHDKLTAQGFAYLFKKANLYSVVIKHLALTEESITKKSLKGYTLIASIPVEDRWHAYYDIAKKFQRRWVKGTKQSSLWALKEKEVEFFKEYSNEYHGDSKIFKHMLEYGKIW